MARRPRKPKPVLDENQAQPPARKVVGRGRPAVFTREEILATAKVAFSKGGYANVTLDDLAARLNTGKGTLYYHSSRKVDLLIAISTEVVGGDAIELRKIGISRRSAGTAPCTRDADFNASRFDRSAGI